MVLLGSHFPISNNLVSHWFYKGFHYPPVVAKQFLFWFIIPFSDIISWSLRLYFVHCFVSVAIPPYFPVRFFCFVLWSAEFPKTQKSLFPRTTINDCNRLTYHLIVLNLTSFLFWFWTWFITAWRWMRVGSQNPVAGIYRNTNSRTGEPADEPFDGRLIHNTSCRPLVR